MQTVTPKRGRALIWPSTLDENPDHKDPRTNHQALPVAKGIKYGTHACILTAFLLLQCALCRFISRCAISLSSLAGANAWVHQRDYKTPHEQNCQ